MSPDSISLRYCQGSSDKVYNVHLTETGGGWTVTAENGRYGGTLKSAVKLADADYETARKEYDKLVLSKTKKGYTAEEGGTPYSGTEHAGEVTPFVPQLLNTVSEEDALALVAADPDRWIAQQKHDGERRWVRMADGEATGANRNGLRVALAAPIAEAMGRLADHGLPIVEVDAEDMGGHLAIFDILNLEGEDLKELPLTDRLEKLHRLEQLIAMAELDDILRVTPTYHLGTGVAVGDLIGRMREKNAEGVVFKDKTATYAGGRPNSGGPQRKLKFVNEATVRVAATRKGARNTIAAMEVMSEGAWIGVGNVSVPPKHTPPETGQLIEVQYLYAYADGSLYQPVFKTVRSDIGEEAATIGQLVYKPAAEAA